MPPLSVRNSSVEAAPRSKGIAIFPIGSDPKSKERQALARLPTTSVLRSLFLGAYFSSPMLYVPNFALLKKIANSPSPILNPDRNPMPRAIVKPLVYDQFCAGTSRSEILARISQIKCLGYAGVILCYGKEMQIQPSSGQPAAAPLMDNGNESCSSGRDEELD
ncbi:MAG: hypothetical protein Q9173_001107 [Seirophora scorigena]